MKYKTLKCNLLYWLSRISPSKDFKMLWKEYLYFCEASPKMAKQIWECIYSNYRFRKKYNGKFKIVSLGWNCLPRTLLTLWMLKPSRGMGEKSMPFDLIATPPKAAAHFLANDFADYFADTWVYKTKNGYSCWYNETWNDIFFPHEPWCGSSDEDLQALKKRMRDRINNFREAMAFDGPVLFVFHKATLWDLRPLNHSKEDIEALVKEVVRLRGEKPFRILIFACDHDDDCQSIEGADLVKLPYPYAGYMWHKEEERFTPEGMKFEIKLLDFCRNALKEMFAAAGRTLKK